MRGLPSCGKSTTARRLATAENGEVIEFDEYFYSQVGTDPRKYDWSRRLLPKARIWAIARVRRALDRGVDPVILDDDNSLGHTTRACVAEAAQRGYAIELREPDSPWWPELRALLRDFAGHRSELTRWAQKLAVLSRATHRVSAASFLGRMERWRPDLTVEDILAASLGVPHVRT